MTDKPLPKPDPEGWSRFERAVDVALHTAPKHRESKAKPGPSNVKELAAILEAEGFRPDSYSLTGNTARECYVLRKDRGLVALKSWSVFYNDRGSEAANRTFDSEALACQDLLGRLRADPLTKIPQPEAKITGAKLL